jgi:membrane dipeptidase
MNPRIVVDAHEDIAYNAIMHGRDFLRSAAETRQREVPPDPMEGSATTGLPDLLRGNVRFVFSTIYVSPASSPFGTGGGSDVKKYRTPEQAYLLAQEQLAYYASLAMDPRVMLVTTRDDVKRVLNADSPQVGLVILMEGADPLITPQHVKEFYEAGVRIIGPAWSQTRYAGGTRAPGPLTALGRELMTELERFALILDTSHMAEQSFFEALELYHGPVMASHSNCREYVPTDRQLSDAMIRALVQRDGVIGAVLFNAFLQDGWREAGKKKQDVTLATVVKHMQRICDIAGDTKHAAIGSDFDGGFGMEAIPAELDTVADLYKIGDALAAAKFGDADIDNILGQNWIRLLRRALPV